MAGVSAYDQQSTQSGCTLYVGNLDRRVDESMLLTIFCKFFQGYVQQCKLVDEHCSNNDPYCFVHFSNAEVASYAIFLLNNRQIYSKKIKVNWATGSTYKKEVTGVSFSIYVGDLGSEIDDPTLHKAFKPFGEVLSARVIKDPDSNVSKGFGFVVYKDKHEAEQAIDKMNGTILGHKTVKVSWATRNKSAAPQYIPQLNYTEVYTKTNLSNTTVYVGNLPDDTSDSLLREIFSPYGEIQEIVFIQEKNVAFIKFDTHKAASTAIVRCNGMCVQNQFIKCWWSRESTPSISNIHIASSSTTSVPMGGGSSMFSGAAPYHMPPPGGPYSSNSMSRY